MSYRVEVTPAAQRQIKKLGSDVQRQIVSCLKALALDPRPAGVVKLSGEENLYRVRLGNYRILYEIQDEVLLILVTKAGHRREIYRR